MLDQQLLFSEIDIHTIGDEDGAAYWALNEVLRAERQPDDPPEPCTMFVGRCRNLPSYFTMRALLARESPGGPLVAAAELIYDTSGTNAHLAQISVDVLPEWRRRGLGRRLLGWAAAQAHQRGRRMLLAASYDRVPAGEAFLRRIGASPGLQSRTSQLVLAEVSRELLARWQADAAKMAAGFELIFWDSVYPEEHIEAFADLCEVMNTAPRGELDLEDEQITPEKVRAWMASMLARGDFVWTIIAREKASGHMVGVTEVFGNPAQPTIVRQGATAVRPEFRGHRIGRWMKAAMLERVIAALPAARFVRTDNATSNAPMLAINIDLGFKPYTVATIWQVETERALGYAS